MAVVDCLNERHLETICGAASDLRLITGSSAPGMKLPAIWRSRGWTGDSSGGAYSIASPRKGTGCLFVAGSCSVATRGQNQWLAGQGVQTIQLSAHELACGGPVNVEPAVRELAAGRHCLIYTSAPPAEVESVQEWARQQGVTREELGLRIVNRVASLTQQIIEAHAPAALVVAGGETAGAICRHLELGALRVGKNIEPGVPLCESLGKFRLPVVLKSGNFGGPDFYGRALRAAGC